MQPLYDPREMQMQLKQPDDGACTGNSSRVQLGAKTPAPGALPRMTQQIQELGNCALELRDELQQCLSILDGFFGFVEAPTMPQAESSEAGTPSEHFENLVDLVEANMNMAEQLRRRLADYL